MPGNHKRIRKARARAEKRRSSSSDQNASSRKSSVSESELGATCSESDSHSPVKHDDDFNDGPFQDFVVPLGDSLENEVNDVFEALKNKEENSTVDTSFTETRYEGDTSHIKLEEKTIQAPPPSETDMGAKLTSHVPLKEATISLTSGKGTPEIIPPPPLDTCKSDVPPKKVGSGSSVDPPVFQISDNTTTPKDTTTSEVVTAAGHAHQRIEEALIETLKSPNLQKAVPSKDTSQTLPVISSDKDKPQATSSPHSSESPVVKRRSTGSSECDSDTQNLLQELLVPGDKEKKVKSLSWHGMSTYEDLYESSLASYSICDSWWYDRSDLSPVEELSESPALNRKFRGKDSKTINPNHAQSLFNRDSTGTKDNIAASDRDMYESKFDESFEAYPIVFSDPGESLSPDDIDNVNTYIDSLFESCFDPDPAKEPEAPEKKGDDSVFEVETDVSDILCALHISETSPLTAENTTLNTRTDEEVIRKESVYQVEHAFHKEHELQKETKVRDSVPKKSKTHIQEKKKDKEMSQSLHQTDGQTENVQSSKSQAKRNLPDVVSSSTTLSLSSGVFESKGAVSLDTKWQQSCLYVANVYNIYKLLEFLYNTLREDFSRGRISEQEATSRVVLQCKGSRLTGAAIQSLDSLNDQIVQYIFAQNNVDLDLEKDLSPRERETLKSSMVLIRGLLIDAQSKFRKMVDDNRQLAVKIDGSIQAANQEVNILRAELADTNKRLSQISLTNDLKVDKATQSESDNSVRHKSDEENELTKMKEENVRLEAHVKSLTREVQELKLAKAASSEHPSYGELKLELIQTRQEVNRAKEALQAMKADRKRLKGEKLDLLNQMKQLYSTLEDKESELRDFICNYEQRVRESDDTIKQLALEKEECEREKWRIIKKAQEAAERAVILRTQCDTKDQALKKLEVELAELRTQPSDHNKSGVSEADHTTHSMASTIASEELPPYETPSHSDASRDDSFSVKTSTPSHDSRFNSLSNPNKSLNASHDFPSDSEGKKKHRIPVFGSLTRMFSKGRLRRSIALPHGETFDDPGHPKLALLSPDNYQEKLQLVNQLKGVHMTNWKANQVLAWLEISLSMPIYGKLCGENIKSGKVLLGLSDSDLSAALGITNSIHRRKLRLAIEEQRDPADIKYPKATTIDHTWVAHKWLPDLGLPQHSSQFESQLADGRLLNQLTKKDLEKHFSVHRKFHQASILHAVELLRLLNFDKEMLHERRSQCEDVNSDPLVWTNERVVKWIKSIELGEYVLNLKESGVHGALMVLEPSFTADTLATALGIPPSKSYLRRHIATELELLIKPARAALDTPNNNTKMRVNGTGSVGRSFIRSYRSSSLDDAGVPKGRLSFRGSLGRAFGRKIKDDLRMTFDSDSTPKSRRGMKISDPIPIQHNHSLDSIVEPDSTPV